MNEVARFWLTREKQYATIKRFSLAFGSETAQMLGEKREKKRNLEEYRRTKAILYNQKKVSQAHGRTILDPETN